MRRVGKTFVAVVLVLAPLAAVFSPVAARSRVVWTAREHIDWFADRFSCHPGATVDAGAHGRIFVATTIAEDPRHSDIRVAAHEAPSGAALWHRRFDVAPVDGALGILVDGPTVFVLGSAGELSDRGPPRSMLVYALSNADGSVRWSQRIRGPDGFADAVSMALSPDGSTLYAAGDAYRATSDDDRLRSTIFVASLDTADGMLRWRATPPGPDSAADRLSGCGDSAPHVVGASDDAVVVAIEESVGINGEGSFAAAALEATDGSLRWWRSTSGYGFGTAIAMSPDGATAYVGGDIGFATVIAYDVASGDRLWRSRARARAAGLAITPNGSRLIAIGRSVGSATWTGALRTASGAWVWERTYQDRDTSHVGTAVDVSPDGRRVYVATWRCTDTRNLGDPVLVCSRDFLVLRYRVDSGAGGMWATYAGPYDPGWELTTDLVVTRRGRVAVTGLQQVGPAPNLCGPRTCRTDYDVSTVLLRETQP